jgi:Tfp pilus assembly protein PilF
MSQNDSANDDVFPDELPPQRVGIRARAVETFQLLVWLFCDWRDTRPWKALLGGLPALLVAGTALVILLIGQLTDTTVRLDIYDQAAVRALKQEDFAAADVYFRRMAVMNDSSPKGLYGVALAAAGRGEYEQARSLMRQIAPENDTGYAWAHLWLATDRLKRGGRLTPEEDRLVEHDLKQALAGNIQNDEVHTLLGQIYWSRGDAKNAIPHLEEAARHRPQLYSALAAMYAKQGDEHSAQTAAVMACKFLAEKAASEPNALDYRLQWALTEVLRQNYPEAVRILQAGLTSADPKRFHDTLAGVYLSWYQAVPEKGKDSLAQRLELLTCALAHEPNNPQALAILAELSSRQPGLAGAAQAPLDKALARGTAPAVVHAILGTRALQKGDLEKARIQLELAYEHDPHMPEVLNNLAWVLATGDKPDLPRALRLAESAKKLSANPEMSVTLGIILARMGRHRQAVKELETALAAFPDRARLHAELAACYAKLGDPDSAKLHQRLAEEGKAKAETQGTKP